MGMPMILEQTLTVLFKLSLAGGPSYQPKKENGEKTLLRTLKDLRSQH